MPQDARAISNLLIEMAEAENYSLSILSLLKLLYFVHAWYLHKHKVPLVGQPFEAWRFGPVVRVVYDQLKGQKYLKVGQRLTKFDPRYGAFVEAKAALSDSDLRLIGDIFSYYSQFHAGHLVDISHEPGGPWDRVWREAEKRSKLGLWISDESILEWFEDEGRAIYSQDSNWRH